MQKKDRGDLILMILLAILCLLPTGIFEGGATPVSDSTTLVSLDHPFKLKVNETAYLDSADLLFRFVNVTEDSRCPSDVQCIWAGQVSVEIEVVRVSTGEGLGNFALTLIGGSENSQKATIGEFAVKLVNVEPHPVSTQTIHLSDYVATLIISASENVDSLNMIYELQAQGGLHIDTVVSPPLCDIAVGQDYWAATLTVKNVHPGQIQDVLFVTQDIDPNGMVESIEINANVTLPASDLILIANKWEPMSSGKHTIEAFIRKMDSSGSAPIALIEKQSLVIEVAKRGC